MSASKSQHFVKFFSPGTLVAEVTSKPVDAWDVEEAKQMARAIKERHGATPYGFQFTTRARSDEDLDSKEIARSPMYYLGGRIETLDIVEARNSPDESVLRANMRGNGWEKIIVNENSWKITRPFLEGDVLVEFEP